MFNLKKYTSAKFLAKAGAISALYVILTIITPAISFGAFQLRVAESLNVLAFIMPEAILGLTVGCAISNLFGYGVLDVILGSLATLISCVLGYIVHQKLNNEKLKFIVCGSFPIIINALVVPLTIYLVTEVKGVYLFNFCSVFVGEFLAVYILGGILYYFLKKYYNNL